MSAALAFLRWPRYSVLLSQSFQSDFDIVSESSEMSPDNAAKPATPRRTTPMQALSSLFRTPTRLRTPTTVSRRNKRASARTSSLSSSTPSTPSTTALPAVVLQTYSVSTDSVILTSLPSVPFCCHEDILTMSRAQLESVVRALNARLPRRMRIGPEDDFWKDDEDRTEECDDDDDGLSRMSEAEMKRRIEELVGIRTLVGKNRVSRSGLGLGTCTGVPAAPKAVRTRDAAWRPCEKTPWEMDGDVAEDHVDDSYFVMEDDLMGSSPLAGRTTSGQHARGRNNTAPRLAILEEENEGSELKEDDSEDNGTRPFKRQRVSFGIVTLGSEGRSRLIENMDLSGSPLLARDDDASSEDFTERGERMATDTINPDCAAKTPKEGVQALMQRRRSARIKAIALKRTSSVDTGKKTTSNAKSLKSSLLRSKTFSSSRSPRNISTTLSGSDTERNSGTPREFTIRLPFASAPPDQNLDSSAWSAPRILRSHSQRLLNASQTATTKSALGRSQSERYPRASDLAFVTIDRPRYRFTQRKSRRSKIAKEGQSNPQSPALPEHGACQLQQGIQISMEQPDRKREHEQENEDPKIAMKNSAMGRLHAVPLALCSILTPRSTAPSTSTIASVRGNCGDSPARLMVKEGTVLTAITDSTVTDSVAESVWEALGRMAMDSA